MRYARQPDKYSCGPTAILNAMKWAGLDATSRNHLPYLQFSCRTIDLQHPEDFDSNGTLDSDFDRVLRYVGSGVFRVRRKKFPSAKELKKHLKKGGAVAICYHWEEAGQSGEHFCFLAGFERGFFVVINDHDAPNTETVRLRTFATIRKWLKKRKDNPSGWFLTMET